MTTEILLKLSGLALLLSGILATVGLSVHPHDAAGSNHAMWLVAHVVVMSGALLNLLGLVGLYLRSARRLGLAGLIAFLLTTISLVLYLGKLYWSGFLYPLVQHLSVVVSIVYTVGVAWIGYLLATGKSLP